MKSQAEIVADPRAFFVDRILEEACSRSVIFTPDELEYLRYARSGEDDAASRVLKRLKSKAFEALDKKVGELIDEAYARDLATQAGAKEKYKAAMEALAAVDTAPNISMFVSHLVFRNDFDSGRSLKTTIIGVIVTAAILALGWFIGSRFLMPK